MRWNLKTLGQNMNIIGCEYNLYSSAAGSKTAHSGVTAKFDPAVQSQFLGQDVGRILVFTQKSLLFGHYLLITHYITLY
jgi:hypothetical protein